MGFFALRTSNLASLLLLVPLPPPPPPPPPTTTTTTTTTSTITKTTTTTTTTQVYCWKTRRRVGKIVSGASAPLSLYLPRQFSLYCRKCFLQALVAKMQSPIKYIILNSDKII